KNGLTSKDFRILRHDAAHERNYALKAHSIQANITHHSPAAPSCPVIASAKTEASREGGSILSVSWFRDSLLKALLGSVHCLACRRLRPPRHRQIPFDGKR